MKKKITLLLSFILLVALFGIPLIVNANDVGATLSLVDSTGKAEYDPGEEFTLELRTSDVKEGAEVLTFYVEFDPEKLEISDFDGSCKVFDPEVTKAELIAAGSTSGEIEKAPEVASKFYVLDESGKQGKTIKAKTLGTIIFKIKENVSGTTKLEIGNVNLTDTSTKVSYDVTKNDVTIKIANKIESKSIEIPTFADKTYTGKEQSVESGEGYTLTGTTKATDAGEYEVTVKLADGYKWDDGSSGDKKISWKINKADATLTLGSTSVMLKEKENKVVTCTYNGDGTLSATSSDTTIATATLSGDKKSITITGVKKGTTVVTVEASGEKNYNLTPNRISVTVEEAPVEVVAIAVPTFEDKTYTGKEQSVEAGEGYSLTGTTKATDAGEYEVTAKLTDGYKWNDNTSGDKKISWKINKAEATLTLGSTSVMLKEKENKVVTCTYNGDGTLSATSSNTSIATATLSSDKKSITVNGVKKGTVEVTITASEGKNYKAISKKISVTVNEDSSIETEDYAITLSIVDSKGKTTYKAGEEVEVKVELSDVKEGVESVAFKMYYDYSKLEIVDFDSVNARVFSPEVTKAEAREANSSKEIIDNAPEKSRYFAVAYYVDSGKILKTGTLGTIKFRILDKASGSAKFYFDATQVKNASDTKTYKAKTNELTINISSSTSGNGGGGGGSSSSTTTYEIKVTDTLGGKISPSTTKVNKGESQKFTIKAIDGYEIADVVVDGKSVGKKTSYTFENVTATHTITAKYQKVEENKSGESGNGGQGSNEDKFPFEDVHSSDWFYDGVKFTWSKKIFNGVSNTEFGPNIGTTRGMIVTLLYRYDGATDEEKSEFDDVNPNTYYSAPIAWAAKNGIVKGIGENEYAPDRAITREELSAIIARFIEYKKLDIEEEDSDVEVFNDYDSISDYAKENVMELKRLGLMQGKTGNIFDPKSYTTRAEVATLLMRFINKVN